LTCLRDAEIRSQPSRSYDLKVARKRPFGQVSAVGAADNVGVACNRGSDKVYVVGVELSREQLQLLWQAVEQVLACASSQLVDDLTDWPVVKDVCAGSALPIGEGSTLSGLNSGAK
jgi:hypothetical protein